MVYPRTITAEARNAYTCETSEYSRSRDEYALRRIEIPSERRTHTEEGPIRLLRYLSWDRESGQVLFEATCVVPAGVEASQFVDKELRGKAEAVMATDGSAFATMAGGWGDAQIECWYDDFTGQVECYGVICHPMLSLGSGADPDSVSDMLLSSYMTWDCDNGCTIWASGSGAWYNCPSAGGGDVCMEDCGGGGDPPPSGTVTVICSPAQLQRGESVTCNATGATDSIQWVFIPDGPDLDSVAWLAPAGSPWGGPMVASGTVSATGYSSGSAVGGGGAQFITVTPRDWSNSAPAPQIRYEGQGDLPVLPEDYEDLGYTLPALEVAAPGWAETIASGPNHGYGWVNTWPFVADIPIYLNLAAFASGSAFMNAQTGGIYCTAAQLSNLESIVRAHEDLHAAIYHETASAQIALHIEGIVGYDVTSQVLGHRSPIHNAAWHASADLHNHSPLQLPCNVNFSY